MLKTQQLVLDFMKAANLRLPPANKVNIEYLTRKDLELLTDLIREESHELTVALNKLWVDFLNFDTTDQLNLFLREDLTEWAHVVKEMCDVIVVIHNLSNAMGIDLEPFFEAVHESNMKKIGGPKREDGKQLKPEGWKKPDLLPILRKQMEDAKNEMPGMWKD